MLCLLCSRVRRSPTMVMLARTNLVSRPASCTLAAPRLRLVLHQEGKRGESWGSAQIGEETFSGP